ncbi:MAG: nucleotidyltransferase family protein [Acidobacteriota bacterium]
MIAVETGMVLAAGLGTRLRPITETLPKPLVVVRGRTLLDRALDHLEAVGVKRAVVNAHYKAEMIERHLAARERPAVVLSREERLLDTGGGVAEALPRLEEPFYVINSDAVWVDGPVPALTRLARAFDPARLDAVLLVHETVWAVGYEGLGDFFLDPWGVPRRRLEREVVPYLFAGVQLLSRRLFEGEEAGAFSMNRLWDKAMERGRILCLVHDSAWFDVGTPEGLAATEARLAERYPSI